MNNNYRQHNVLCHLVIQVKQLRLLNICSASNGPKSIFRDTLLFIVIYDYKFANISERPVYE